MTAPKDPIDPGEGYRLIEEGEIMRAGDEYFGYSETWEVISECATATVNRPWTPKLYCPMRPVRRKIETPAHEPVIKPPLGVVPGYVWAQHRAADLLAAMTRYVDAGEKIPLGWLNELEDRLHEARLVELVDGGKEDLV